MRTIVIAGLTVLAMFALGPRPLGAQSAVSVDIQDFSFQPHEWTIQAGTVVTWVNHDEWPHHVVAEDGKGINSGIIASGKEFQFTFAQPGRYSYRCGIHPTMLGVIVVQGQ